MKSDIFYSWTWEWMQKKNRPCYEDGESKKYKKQIVGRILGQ